MIFGIEYKWIILTHTMYCWLVLSSRVTMKRSLSPGHEAAVVNDAVLHVQPSVLQRVDGTLFVAPGQSDGRVEERGGALQRQTVPVKHQLPLGRDELQDGELQRTVWNTDHRDTGAKSDEQLTWTSLGAKWQTKLHLKLLWTASLSLTLSPPNTVFWVSTFSLLYTRGRYYNASPEWV